MTKVLQFPYDRIRPAEVHQAKILKLPVREPLLLPFAFAVAWMSLFIPK
jgi:hypothetical protein